ncbi:hypothetical protein EXIGLDRAFT_758857 [Exidia glandulosa HHB12029]|uniref:Uncharacterized protein n=1 Tax=Exidia glandulosa HHB12029 TaxID=1314781 RepID=A0A165QEW7_EXIGL|nr:hypothetical protein EXIGLDRAFT_758857 [Exidia glandulosa HHB12029]
MAQIVIIEKAYVGVIFRNYLVRHTAIKAVRAHTISCLIFGVLDRKCVEVPPFPARRLYMDLVDPHLTHGCDIRPDHTLSATRRLEAVQKRFLRKALRLGPRCSVAALYTEMGIAPVRYRRADLAIRFLGYLLQCLRISLVRRALADSVMLVNSGQKSWYSDMRRALALLPVPVYLQTTRWSVDVEAVRNSCVPH